MLTRQRLQHLRGLPRRLWRLLVDGPSRLDQLAEDSRTALKMQRELTKRTGQLVVVRDEARALRGEVKAMRRELQDRLLQYHLQLGRLARAVGEEPADNVRLSGRTVPVTVDESEAPPWEQIAGVVAPDPLGQEWLVTDGCPVCGHDTRTVVNPWNKLILLAKAPDETSARYDYAVCHACGVLGASRRPLGSRYQFLLEHFGEVTAKRGGGREIANRLLNPYPLTDADREELRRLAAPGVFVSEHLGLRPSEHLAGLLRDRLENSVHIDIIGSLVEPRGGRVLEVRSRAGTILDGLRRAYGAQVFAMPIWESQQFLLREVYGIETSDIIDFDRFTIPFAEPFDVIVCNHMFTHVLRPVDFFAEVRRHLKPGGYIYLHNEPDDAEFLEGKQSMLATLNPLHMQAFDQHSLVRAMSANGFETVFVKRRNLAHICLARKADVRLSPMDAAARTTRVEGYQRAFDRAVLGVDPEIRARVAGEWPQAVERGVASGAVEFDARGQLRLTTRS